MPWAFPNYTRLYFDRLATVPPPPFVYLAAGLGDVGLTPYECTLSRGARLGNR
jgi:hypothetical protein